MMTAMAAATPTGRPGRAISARLDRVDAERCSECGYDAGDQSDADAMRAIGLLPAQWVAALDGLAPRDLLRRPVADRWSIAEYADHVREVLFAMRFLADTAVIRPGSDLGEVPTAPFDAEPRQVDVPAALSGIDREAGALVDALGALAPAQWDVGVTVGGSTVDAHWIVHHAVHDATHHLLDVERLRAAL
jgi:hypothetical protein